ncbi:MAG: hypothetical protein AM324_000520 [Candidatus Thorarchaeota archaeon SMTZ1-83]|nr:MAG: hypothetical protein AM324_01270 [Candidatus Thorarchaeota archaeon SMTZ1-83]
MKQERLTRPSSENESVSGKKARALRTKTNSTRHIEINLTDFKTHPLWDILVETARENPRYASLTGYTREVILTRNPDITPQELAGRLSVTLGESIVILDDAKSKE